MKDILLTKLRRQETPCEEFRAATLELAELLAADAAQCIPSKRTRVTTPLSSAAGVVPVGRVVLVAILRAGLSLLPAFMKLFPGSPIGIFGIRRDEVTKEPHLYYENIPALLPDDHIFLLDPMIATAGSVILALEHLGVHISPSQITVVGVLAATPGMQKLKHRFPVVRTLVAAEDPELDSRAFIVPGLGDFGDRFFGTD